MKLHSISSLLLVLLQSSIDLGVVAQPSASTCSFNARSQRAESDILSDDPYPSLSGSTLVGVGSRCDQPILYDLSSSDAIQTINPDSTSPLADQRISHLVTTDNGNVLLLAVYDDSVNDSTCATGTVFANKVRVFARDSPTSTWVQRGTDILGSTIDFFGDSMYANSDGSTIALIDSDWNAHILELTSNGDWAQRGSLLSPAYSGIEFSSDGNRVAVADSSAYQGDELDDTYRGVVKVYDWDGSDWKLEAEIYGDQPDVELGDTISMTSDGTLLAVAVPFANLSINGEVHMYQRDTGSGTWERKRIFQPDDTPQGFGSAVALSADGTRMVVGAEYWEPSDRVLNSGRAFVYVSSNGLDWEEIGTLDGDASNDNIGYYVSVNEAGTLVAAATSGSPNYILVGEIECEESLTESPTGQPTFSPIAATPAPITSTDTPTLMPTGKPVSATTTVPTSTPITSTDTPTLMPTGKPVSATTPVPTSTPITSTDTPTLMTTGKPVSATTSAPTPSPTPSPQTKTTLPSPAPTSILLTLQPTQISVDDTSTRVPVVASPVDSSPTTNPMEREIESTSSASHWNLDSRIPCSMAIAMGLMSVLIM